MTVVLVRPSVLYVYDALTTRYSNLIGDVQRPITSNRASAVCIYQSACDRELRHVLTATLHGISNQCNSPLCEEM